MFAKLKEINVECANDALCGVNMVADVEDASEVEIMHFPIISAPRRVKKNEPFEVTVEIGGKTPHPNESEHFIQFIELYAGETFLTRMDYVPRMSRPVMKATITMDHSHGLLRAFGRCNQYGTWLAEKEIEVTD